MKCCVIGCKSDNCNKDIFQENRLSFFSFPKEETLKNKWIKLVNRIDWKPSKYSKICSMHFHEKDFIKIKRGYRLIEGACPAILIPEQCRNKTPEPCDLNEFLIFNDTPRKKKLKEEIARLRINEKKNLLKLRRAQKRVYRLKKKVKSIEYLIDELKKKNVLQEEEGDILSLVDMKVKELVSSSIRKSKGLPTTKKYSPALRTFALTLNYYSPKAYSYVREVFDTCLPHPRTIAKWYENIDGEAGFTSESFKALKLKSENSADKILCSFVMDEVAIKRHIEWDGKKYHGYVDLGTNIAQNDNCQEASQALVMLLVCLKERWKVPVGFFFIHSLTGEQRASLVKQCLYKCHESSVEVVSLTMDGCAANITMCKKLGCSFAHPNVKTTFQHPSADYHVAILLDACHMLKLVRNTFETKKVLIDYQGNEVSWMYLEQLNEFQKSIGMHIGNKLKDSHLDYGRQKMKVKLASQLFSNSVADALITCENNNIFSGVQPTVFFIRLINDLFDILNSRSMQHLEFKKPLFEKNFVQTEHFLNYAKHYLLHLSAKNENNTLVNTNRKTGFIGFIFCIESTLFLYRRLVQTEKKLQYLTTHKLSQDHLELLFGVIRAHGRTNNNPTTQQFKAAYKKILINTEVKSCFNGNCIPLEDLNILSSTSSIKKINATAERGRLFAAQDETNTDEPIPDDVLIAFDDEFADIMSSNIRRQIVTYIAGYVVKSIVKQLHCENCLNALFADKYVEDHYLIKLKDKGGLIFPSPDVIDICLRTESAIKTFLSNESIINKNKVIYQTMKTLIGENRFENLQTHMREQLSPLNNHLNLLCKCICEKYTNIRFSYIATLKNHRNSKRQLFNKTILFTGD